MLTNTANLVPVVGVSVILLAALVSSVIPDAARTARITTAPLDVEKIKYSPLLFVTES